MNQIVIHQRISFVKAVLLLGILLIMGVAVYYSSLSYGFYFDDAPNITKLFDIRHRTFSDLFFAHTRWISFWLNTVYFKIAHFEPFIYHLGNLCIHLLNGAILFWILCLLLNNLKSENFFKTNALAIAWATAGLFLIHPVASQTVCYVIQGQLEGLSTLAIVLMVLLFWYSSQATIILFKCLAVGLLLLVALFATGTKEIVIVAPFLLLLIDWFFIAQGEWGALKKRLWLHAAVFGTLFLSFAYTYGPAPLLNLLKFKQELVNTYGNVLTQHHEVGITTFDFLCSQFKVMLHYIFIYFWPFNISLDYDWKIVDGFWEIDCLVPFLVLLCLGFWLLIRIRRNRTDLIVFGWVWWFVCMMPRTSIFPSSELIADYKTYGASIGILFIIGSLLVLIARACLSAVAPSRDSIFWAFLFLLLVPWGVLCYRRTKVWQSAESLWRDISYEAPTKARVWNNLGAALVENQKYNEAIHVLEKAIKLDKRYPDPWNNLSVAYANMGNIEKALEACEMLIKLNPNHIEGYNNLATFLIIHEQYKDAEEVLHQALGRRPYYGKALFNLGRIYYLQDKMREAQHYFKLCCTKGDLDNAMGYSSWGMASMKLKEYKDALTAYSKAVALCPEDDELKRHLAYAYLFNNDLKSSEKLFKELYIRNPQDVQIILGLAEMYVVAKQFAQALDLYKKIVVYGKKLPMIYLRAAGCAYKIGLYELSGEYLQKYLATNPPSENVQQINEILAALQRRDFSKKSWAWLN